MLSGLILALAFTIQSPVNYEISLAGNFAEPRPNHFHGGTDIKTGGVEGKAIFAVDDGFVAMVSIGIGGYGNALYVQHPNGTTSQYCHLKKFTPQIAAMVRTWQYKHHQSSGIMHFMPTDMPVAQRQFIAVSGNTGASQAPHLHLELHDTRSWDMLDPLEFFADHVKDTYAPLAHGFMAYPVYGEGCFYGGSTKQTYGFSNHNLTRQFTAWGKVGFGLWANDYSEVTYNRLGVRQVQLYVDDKLWFQSNTSRIPADDNMQVNAWGDYEHYLRYHVWYMRSYVPSGVTLPIFKVGADRGIVNFCEQRNYHLKYVLTDQKGNSSTYTFTVRATPTTLPKKQQTHPLFTLSSRKPYVVQLPGMSLSVGPNNMAETLTLKPQVKFQLGKLSNAYRLTPGSTPLFHYSPISIRLNRKVKDPTKLYIVGHFGTDKYFVGTYSNGWVTGSVRDLGASYEIAIDEEAPQIMPVNQASWGARGMLTIALADKHSGVKSYEAFIDGRFVLFEQAEKSNLLHCNIATTPIKRTHSAHQLKFIAADNCGNKRTFTASINY